MAVQDIDNNSPSSSSAGKFIKYAIVLILLVLVGLLVGFGITSLTQNSGTGLSLPELNEDSTNNEFLVKLSQCGEGAVEVRPETLEGIENEGSLLGMVTVKEDSPSPYIIVEDMLADESILAKVDMSDIISVELREVFDQSKHIQNDASGWEHTKVVPGNPTIDQIFDNLPLNTQVWVYDDLNKDGEVGKTLFIFCKSF